MYYLVKSKETGCWLRMINGKPTFVEKVKHADLFDEKYRAEGFVKELPGVELWRMIVDLTKVAVEEEGLKTLTGKLYLYTEMGEISEFTFWREHSMSFHAIYSISEAESITIYSPDKTEIMWSGPAKGKNRQAMVATGCKGLIPEAFPTEKAKDWAMWCVLGYPAELKTYGKSWGEKSP